MRMDDDDILALGAAWPSRRKRRIFYGKGVRWKHSHKPPIPHSVQEQGDTRDIPGDGRNEERAFPGLFALYPLVFHRSHFLITHHLELTVNLLVFAPGGPSWSHRLWQQD